MQDISDDVLIKASQGDLKSFEELYKASAGFVYNVALRIVNNREDAEEVTQEIFFIIYHKLRGFRFESSFKTWIYRITVNYSINFARKTSITRNKTIEYEDTSIAGTVVGDVQKGIDKEHREKVIEDLLNIINPDQRACIVLRNMEGLSYEQIAQTLKININTVRTRLKRAREKLLRGKKAGGLWTFVKNTKI